MTAGKKARREGNPRPEQTAKRKEKVLKALENHTGLVTYAAKAAGISRATFYQWKRDDPEFAEAVEEIEEAALDEVENVVYDMILKEHNPAVTIFYLKTKGKKRGYIERREIEMNTGDLSSLRDTMNELASNYEQDY